MHQTLPFLCLEDGLSMCVTREDERLVSISGSLIRHLTHPLGDLLPFAGAKELGVLSEAGDVSDPREKY